MRDKQVARYGVWNIASVRGAVGGFCAWGKMGAIVADDPLHEPGEHVFFEFGETREGAVKNLLSSLGVTE